MKNGMIGAGTWCSADQEIKKEEAKIGIQEIIAKHGMKYASNDLILGELKKRIDAKSIEIKDIENLIKV